MFRRSRCNVHSNMRIIHICLEDFVRAVCLVLDRNGDKKKKKKKKELYSQRMESQYFNGKKYVFKACLLFINFFHRVVSTSVRKLSRKSWFLEAAEYRFYNCFENFSNISFFSFHRSCFLSSSSRWVKSSPRRIPRKRINISKTCLHQFVEKL